MLGYRERRDFIKIGLVATAAMVLPNFAIGAIAVDAT
ncbi:MAG: twin-arginine translocation signal domain-containing protein [Symbiopectobacterium sp.]